MSVKSVVISSGHGSKVRGASGVLDEVDEARRVVDNMANMLKQTDVTVKVFHDDVSTEQNENLQRIVGYHNSQQRDLDVSVHFNAYQSTSNPMGTECLYVTQSSLAEEVADAIAQSGQLIDRGPKYRSDLYFLNNTAKPAILIEVCFVDSSADAKLYNQHFESICEAIVEAICDVDVDEIPPDTEPPPIDPPDPGPDPEPPTQIRPTLSKGDSGDDVVYLQQQLNEDNDAGLTTDGDFGSRTESAVLGYQASRNLDVDGVVGPQTWIALDMDAPPYVPPGLPPPLSDGDIEEIIQIADDSYIAGYSWRDRGVAPPGYIHGFALSFANVYRKWMADHAPAIQMAKQRSSSDKDVFNEYEDEFQNAGLDTEAGGADALLALYSLLLGLGMRESSGRHCEGRDMSADNVSSDTCEAGLYQTSYNAHSCHQTFDQTFNEYASGGGGGNPQGFLNVFAEAVYCDSSSWSCYGSGAGYQFQLMCKEMPAFAVETCAITLRNLCNHYGPIIRHEAELKVEAAIMLRQVMEYIEENTPSG